MTSRHQHPRSEPPAQHHRQLHLDRRSPLVLDTHDLLRTAGARRTVRTSVPAPADLGTPVIGVPSGSPLDLDLNLDAVIEGVLVTGTVSAQLTGQCVRCLTAVADEAEVEITELFGYPGGELADQESEDETSLLDGELLDLEPVLRDSLVLELPFQPVCRPDCQGLCPDCGADLNAAAATGIEHSHDAVIDPRWAALATLDPSAGPEKSAQFDNPVETS